DTLAIAPGQTLTNKSISVPADIDVFTFTGASKEAVTIRMNISDVTASAPVFDLYGTNGVLLAEPSSRDGRIAYLDAFPLTQSGVFLIACRDDGCDETFTFNLTLVNSRCTTLFRSDTLAIAPGQTLTNKSISVPADIDVFTFTGAS